MYKIISMQYATVWQNIDKKPRGCGRPRPTRDRGADAPRCEKKVYRFKIAIACTQAAPRAPREAECRARSLTRKSIH